MLTICKNIFNEFNNEKVNYCHWKSNEHLIEGLNGITDLDLLVSNDHQKKFSAILKNNNCILVSPQYGARYPKVEEWVGYDGETGKLIHLHVHYRMITGTKHVKEYTLPWDALALDTRVLDETGTVYIMEPHLELVVLYTRIVLKERQIIGKMDKFEIARDYRKEIQWLKERINAEALSRLLESIWSENREEVLGILLKQRPTKSDYAKLQELVKNEVQLMRNGTDFDNKVKHKLRKYIVNVKGILKKKCDIVPFTRQKVLPKKGVSFAFIGCDGSGKSNITKEICNWLSWKMDCQNFYFGMGERYKKPLVYKVYKSNNLPEALKKIAGLLFFYKVAVRCKRLRNSLEVYTDKGGIAICDRYPQVQFKGIYDGPKIEPLGLYNKTAIGKWLAKRERTLLADVEKRSVDVVFKLIVPPQVAVNRSPGHSIKEVSKKASITEKLQFPMAEVYEINATQPWEEEIIQIKGIIWKKLMESQS